MNRLCAAENRNGVGVVVPATASCSATPPAMGWSRVTVQLASQQLLRQVVGTRDV